MADPTVSQVYQTSIPQELLPYAQTMLDTASQYTDIAKNPYQQYTGERVAQLSPLTQQAMDTAGQMQVAGQVGAGTDIAGAAGLQALQQNTFANPYAASAYMSPFMQNVVDVQQREAKRQAAIQNQATQAQAAQAGAFGGARDYILRGEANRALQGQLQGIQATGLQNAFQNAQQQFNQEQQQRLAGSQAATQAANALQNLGQAQYQQSANIVGLQSQLGQQEQQRAQDVLNAQYQDFLNYQNYPYKQLGFMSDLIRGTPTTQSASTIYQAPPSTMQNLMSLGLGAYGINQLTKAPGQANGGITQAYAKGGITQAYEGGGSVFSPEFKRYAVDHISPNQLPIAQRNALARGDRETADFATDEMALDAAIRRGIGAAFTPDMADNIVRAAGGGILAFKEDGYVDSSAVSDADEEGVQEGLGGTQLAMGPANPSIIREAQRRIRAMDEFTPQVADPKTIAALRAQRIADVRKELGPNTGMEDFRKYLRQADVDRGEALSQGKGLAALEAAGAVLDPAAGGNAMRGFGMAGKAFAQSYGQAMQADRKEKRALAEAGYHLADADRKERMGLMKEADAAEAAHRGSIKEANKFNFDKLNAQSNAMVKLAQATRQTGGAGGAGGKERDQAAAMRVYGDDLKRQFPDMPPEQIAAQALTMYLEKKGSGLPGVEARTDAASQKEARTAFNNRTQFGGDSLAKEYRAADKAGDTAKAAELKAQIAAEEGYVLPGNKPAGGGGGKGGKSDANLQAKATAAFGSYDANKYDYRITDDGRVQRKLKE